MFTSKKGLIFLCVFPAKNALCSSAVIRTAKNEGGFKRYIEIGGAKMAGTRNKITLACTECKQRNYNTKKNKKNDPDRIELNKYCRFCRKHTLHRETK